MCNASSSFRLIWRRVGPIAAVVCFSLLSNDALANELQSRICRASLGLGQAVARLVLFGGATNGNIPPDQRRDIQTNLTNAAAEMIAAESLMRGPIATDRANKNILRSRTEEISRYARATAGQSYQRQAGYISTVFGKYRQGLEVTYVSSRPDALRYNANCDVYIALACYHFARATIASVIDSRFGNEYQAAANGSFRDAVYKGFDVAMDAFNLPRDPGHTPPDGHAKKICCTMGTPFEWRPMELPAFQTSSPLGFYRVKEQMMLAIINAAIELDPVCAAEGERSASSAIDSSGGHATARCNRIVGRWRWFTGNVAEFSEGHRWRTIEGSAAGDTGSWRCNRDGSVDVIPDAGGWLDTVTVSDDGGSLVGQNKQGVRVTGTRVGTAGGSAAGPAAGLTSCSAPGARIVFELIDPPPWSGRNPVCVSADGGQWLQTGSTMHRITQLARGARSAENGCFANSRIVTASRAYSGTLCPR